MLLILGGFVLGFLCCGGWYSFTKDVATGYGLIDGIILSHKSAAELTELLEELRDKSTYPALTIKLHKWITLLKA